LLRTRRLAAATGAAQACLTPVYCADWLSPRWQGQAGAKEQHELVLDKDLSNLPPLQNPYAVVPVSAYLIDDGRF